MEKNKTEKVERMYILNLILFMALLVVGNSCIRIVKEVTDYIEVDKLGYWNRSLHYNTTLNFKANGIADEDKFYSIGPGGLAIHTNLETSPNTDAPNTNTLGHSHKPVMSEKMSARFSGNQFRAVNLRMNKVNATDFYFAPAAFKEDFKDYAFLLRRFDTKFGVFNENNNRFVTIITGPNAPFYGYGTNTYFLYLDFIATQESHYISITDIGYWDDIKPSGAMHFHKNNFYAGISTSGLYHLVEISNDNNVTILPNPLGINEAISAFVTFQDHLFVQMHYNGLLGYSFDTVNWHEIARITPARSDWRAIDDYLFTYWGDRVYFIENVFGSIALYGLPVANVEGATITSVSKFKDDLVLTTTNGIYFKSFELVMKDKERRYPKGDRFHLGELGD